MSEKFSQHYYTSAVKGLGSGPGFQTYSMSEDMTEAERTELEGYCVYKRPSHLPPNPTLEEISTFPKSFSFIRLNDGKYALSLTQYAGRDYSGRFGNSFSHTFITDRLLANYPFTYGGSSLFVNRLSKEESERETMPAPLPVLTHLPAGKMDISSVLNFLHEQNGWHDLKKMVTGVMEGNQSGKKIILVEKEEKIMLWTAAVQLCFPLHLAHSLTFSTYSYDPLKSKALLNGAVSDGTALVITEGIMKHQAYVFDFERNRFSELNEIHPYADFTVSLLKKGWESAVSFYTFLTNLQIQSIDESLSHAKDLYLFFEQSAGDVPGDRLAAALEYASGHAPLHAVKEMAASLKEGLENPEDQKAFLADLDIHLVKSVTGLLFKGSSHEETPGELTVFAAGFFMEGIEHLLKKSHSQADVEQIIELCMATSKKNPYIIRLYPSKLSEILKWYDAKHWAGIINRFIKDGLLKEKTWEELSGSEKDLLKRSLYTLISWGSESILNALLKDFYRPAGNTLLILYSQNHFLKEITEILKGHLQGHFNKLLELNEPGAKALYLNLQKEAISISGRPLTDYLSLPSEGESLQEAALIRYMRLESPESIKRELQVLMDHESRFSITPEFKWKASEKVEKLYLFNMKALQDAGFLKKVYEWKKNIPSKEKPDRATLLAAGCMTYAKEIMPESIKKELKQHVAELDEGSYYQYVSWVLPVLIKTVDQQDILKMLSAEQRPERYWNALISLEGYNHPSYLEALNAAIWIFCREEKMSKQLKESIAEYLMQNKKLFKQVCEKMEQKKQKTTRSKTNHWVDLKEQVESGQSLLGKMKGLFIRK